MGTVSLIFLINTATVWKHNCPLALFCDFVTDAEEEIYFDMCAITSK